MATATQKKLEPGDLRRAWWIWTFFNLSAFSMERMQAPAFVYMMSPILKRLYSDPADIKAALKTGRRSALATTSSPRPPRA